MPKWIDHDSIVTMRKAGRSVPEIAKVVGCCERSVSSVLSAHGLRLGQRKFTCDRATLLKLWQKDLTMIQIGIALGCSSATVTELAREMRLPRRMGQRKPVEPGVTPEEDAASADSLALSPYVQRRIKELGLGMPA